MDGRVTKSRPSMILSKCEDIEFDIVDNVAEWKKKLGSFLGNRLGDT